MYNWAKNVRKHIKHGLNKKNVHIWEKIGAEGIRISLLFGWYAWCGSHAQRPYHNEKLSY